MKYIFIFMLTMLLKVFSTLVVIYDLKGVPEAFVLESLKLLNGRGRRLSEAFGIVCHRGRQWDDSLSGIIFKLQG